MRSAPTIGPWLFPTSIWARLLPWRDALAEFFDLPGFLPYLDRLRSIHIACLPRRDSCSHDLPQALLLAGWLASSLGLQPTERSISADHYALHLSGGLRQLDVHITVGEPSDPVVVRLQAQASPSQPTAEFSVALEPATGQMTATALISGEEPYVRKRLMVERDEGYLLFQELDTFDRDQPYERALLTTSSMLDPRYQPAAVRGSLLV